MNHRQNRTTGQFMPFYLCFCSLSILLQRILTAPLIPVTDRIVDFHFDFNCKLSLPIGYFQLSVVPLTSQIQQLQNLTHMFFFFNPKPVSLSHFSVSFSFTFSCSSLKHRSVPFSLSLVSPFQLVIKPC